jgi:hypothetical protein
MSQEWSDAARFLDQSISLRYLVSGAKSIDAVIENVNEKLKGRGLQLRIQDHPTVERIAKAAAELIGDSAPDLVKAFELVDDEGKVVSHTVAAATNPCKEGHERAEE